MENKKTIAIFDFDGTIARGDSFLAFLKFMVGNLRFYSGMVALSHWVIGYKIGVVPNYRAKEMVTRWFFKGWNEKDFNKKAKSFSSQLEKIIKESALQKIHEHKESGHEVVVVSASFENYLKPWCEKKGLICIGTRLEVLGGKITGRFRGRNCYGYEKVRRLKEKFSMQEYAEVHAYGDSAGDRELLELAHVKNYRSLT